MVEYRFGDFLLASQKVAKASIDSYHFCYIKPLFRLINVKNDGNKANNRLKIFDDSNLIAIFAEILQNQC